jgi:hypothetical protein
LDPPVPTWLTVATSGWLEVTVAEPTNLAPSAVLLVWSKVCDAPGAIVAVSVEAVPALAG